MKAIVFDFDGVIVDSNRLKYEAWYELFPAEEVPPVLIKDVLARIPETRFEILREIFVKLGKPINEIEEFVNIYAQKYNELVQKSIFMKGFNPGVKEALKRLSWHHNLYINSATPKLALQESVARLDIEKFFKGIYGKASSKEETLAKIKEQESIEADEMIFIGDGESDYEAARAFGCPFIGITKNDGYNNWKSVSQPFPIISDLSELEGII